MSTINVTVQPGATVNFQLPADAATPLMDRLTAIESLLERIMSKVNIAGEALNALNTTTNVLAEAVDKVIADDAREDAAYDAKVADLQALVAELQAGKAVDSATIAELNEGFDALLGGVGNTEARLKAVRDALAAMGSQPSDPIPTPEIPPVVETPTELPPAETPSETPTDTPTETPSGGSTTGDSGGSSQPSEPTGGTTEPGGSSPAPSEPQ